MNFSTNRGSGIFATVQSPSDSETSCQDVESASKKSRDRGSGIFAKAGDSSSDSEKNDEEMVIINIQNHLEYNYMVIFWLCSQICAPAKLKAKWTAQPSKSKRIYVSSSDTESD